MATDSACMFDLRRYALRSQSRFSALACSVRDMDGFTQGVIGAAASSAVFGKTLGRWSSLIGFASGMLADADFVVRSSSDPLLSLVFHRTVSHSLVFIPVGAFLAALPFLFSPWLRARRRNLYLCALLGYATHAPLDATTSYGTVLFWPFSDWRVSGDIMSFVDPVFTIALLVGVIWGAVRRSTRPARVGLAVAAAYMVLCLVQHERGLAAQRALLAERGHTPLRARLVNTPGNAVLYRSVYRDGDGVMYADSIRIPFFGPATVREGSRLAVFGPESEKLLERARRPDRMKRDLDRYRWFSDGFWGRDPGEPELIGDMRITADPAGFSPLWGFRITPDDDIPIRPVNRGGGDLDPAAFLRELVGRDSRHRLIFGSGSSPRPAAGLGDRAGPLASRSQ